MLPEHNIHGYVTRGQLEQSLNGLRQSLEAGEILIPVVPPNQPSFAGGVNHAPNSDLSFSKDAATIAGTLPGTAGDGNHEAYRLYRQAVGANITVSAANALKATGHSLFAANEGADSGLPRWDRVNGWIISGSAGTQYDLALHLFGKIVGPGQRWFLHLRVVSLTAEFVPDVQFYAGIWHKTGSGEGWIQGSPFDLTHTIHGIPGSQSIDYRVLAKTDSGVAILSNILNVPNAPDVLSTNNYVKLFYGAGPGFIEFHIFKLVGGVYSLIHVVRNSTDLQFNDIGVPGQSEHGWPVVSENAPRAYAQTRNLIVAPFGSTWRKNELRIDVPSNYDYSETIAEGQFLRFGFTGPTENQQIGLDRIWLSTTFNEWAPDQLPPFSDGTRPIPSISPTQGSQGATDGVYEPPSGGSGGGTCITTRLPVLVHRKRRQQFSPFKNVQMDDRIKGEHGQPYSILEKRLGTSSEYFVIKTMNGIHYECNGLHELIVDLATRKTIQAQQIIPGETLLACWVKGRKYRTLVTVKKLVPEPVEVGTFRLRHPGGLSRDGHGMYVAGRSLHMDRGLYSANTKRQEELLVL